MKSKLFMFCLLIGTLFYSHNVSSQIVINEVYPSGTVELKNMGTAAVDLTNYWLCDRPTYRRIGTLSIASGNVSNLAPDELLVIDNFDFLDPAEDELALYNSSSFGSATAIMDFVQWGAPSSPSRAGLAVSAGLWDAATSVTPAIATGESLQFNGSTVQLSTPADFFLNTPSIGAENMMSSDPVSFEAVLSGLQENPAALTNASGTIQAVLTGNELVITGSFANLSGDFDANIAGGAHVHRALAGRNGGISFLLNTTVSGDLRSGTYEALNNTFILTPEQLEALDLRELYVNIHTTAFPGGELRGQLLPAADSYFQSALLGSNEVPSINTTAGGNLLFELNGDQLTVSGSFGSLSSEIRIDLANGAHIHDNFAGRNGPVVFPLNPTYDADNLGASIEASNNTFTLTPAQVMQLQQQGNYINVHSVNFPTGELRGQILPASSAAFRAQLTGTQEVPAIDTAANGRIALSYDGESTVYVSGSFNNLSSDLNTALAGGIHVHLGYAGRNGGIEFLLNPDVAADNRNAIINPTNNTFTLTPEQIASLFDRELYVNVHSLNFAPGELRGQLLPLQQTYLGTNLSGQNEVQPVLSNAVGNLALEITNANLVVTGGFSGLEGNFDANIAGGSHLHLADASGNGGIEILLNATTDADLRGGVYTPAQNTFAITESQRAALLSGQIYLNIHTQAFASGELRGQILRDDNAFPVSGFDITSPVDNASVSINTDATIYTVAFNATTDANEDLLVYTYQLSETSTFDVLLVNEKFGTATSFEAEGAIRDALIELGVSQGSTQTLYQRILASDGSVSSPSIAQTIQFTLDCEVIASDIIINTTGINNTTSVAEDGLSAVICVDSVADPIAITLLTPEDSQGANAGWIITDAETGTILGLPAAGPFDLNGAGPGVCQIWYIRYEDGLLGRVVDGNIDDLEGCFDLSNPVDVIREVADGGTVAIDLEATGNPNGTTTFNGDTEAVICVDGQMDPIVVIHENPGSENLSYRYVITDAATGLILNVVATNSISLDPAGPGTCEIWGWSYRGVPNNGLDQIGQPLSSLDDLDCSDISDNAITVIREAADGGTVSLANGELEATICAGDDIPDPLEVVHTTTAENLTYLYVITDSDPDQTILGIGGSTIDLEGSGEGVCRIWGWSYRGLAGGTEFIGFPLADLQAEPCSEISENFIEVTRLTGEDCLLLSTDDVIRDEFEISMYPNPAQNFVNIDFSNATNSDIEVSVYDVTGKLIKNVTLNSNSSQMDVSEFSSGAYLVQITNKDSGTSITKQLVKR